MKKNKKCMFEEETKKEPAVEENLTVEEIDAVLDEELSMLVAIE